SDSVALLFLFSNLKNKIAAAYIDHGLRKKAKKEKAFVKNLCKKLGIPFFTKKVNTKKFALKNKKSIEESARILRYSSLTQIALNHGFKKIATAHTLNDRIETVFLKIFRGGGILSLAGIPKKTKINKITVIRPLLVFQREELKNYLKKKKTKFMTDETNRNLKFLRNKIRNLFFPFIKKNFDENFEKRIYSISLQAEEMAEFVFELTKKLKKGILERKRYLRYNPFIRKCFLAEFLGGKVNTEYINKIDRFIESGKGGTFIIKGGKVLIKRGKIKFEKTS
ncbi:MAG: tRNA lysidine(34) synthetase TilS, partial [Elusimicrobia bacterium]|nr:tRNA lysidine(34) synthetase TilS [Elusimicrobiota bacterium]